MVELVDAPDSKSGSVRSVGSIPTARTNIFFRSYNAVATEHLGIDDVAGVDHAVDGVEQVAHGAH